MTCPLCLAVIEAGEAQYVGHLLSEHVEAQLVAAAGFAILPLAFKNRYTQLAAGFGITAVAILFMRRAAR
jgi:hypothetical protein